MTSQTSKTYRLAIAGSTQYSQKIAETIAKNPAFKLIWVLTPPPKKVGRQQILTINPLAEWAKNKKINTFLVPDNLKNPQLKKQIRSQAIDVLLVVDFGYFVPDWLLAFPEITTLNIHPSLLPRWRGSAPGQFAILFKNMLRPWQDQIIGGSKTAVTLMTVSQELDAGDIIVQKNFTIKDDWILTDYYQHAFQLISKSLAQNIKQFIAGQLSATAQSKASPTPFAQRLSKIDAYVSWSQLSKLLSITPEKKLNELSANKSGLSSQKEALLCQLLAGQGILGKYLLSIIEQMQLVSNACRAFQPWPGLWTILPTHKGEQRLKILTCQVEKLASGQRLVLKKVQLAGKEPCQFKQMKNLLK